MLNDDNYLNYLGKFFSERQVEKIDPLLDWLKSEFGFKPVVYSSFFGGKQEEGLVKAVEDLLKKTDNCELASIDAIASAAHSLVIAIGIFRGKLNIEEAIELIRLEEDLQVLFFFFFAFLMLLSFSSSRLHKHIHPNNIACLQETCFSNIT